MYVCVRTCIALSMTRQVIRGTDSLIIAISPAAAYTRTRMHAHTHTHTHTDWLIELMSHLTQTGHFGDCSEPISRLVLRKLNLIQMSLACLAHVNFLICCNLHCSMCSAEQIKWLIDWLKSSHWSEHNYCCWYGLPVADGRCSILTLNADMKHKLW